MIEFAIITALILLNGVFVAAEFAIVGAPRAAIDARAGQGDRLARLVQSVLHDPRKQDRYIATAQLGITLASLGLGMYGEHVLADAIYEALGASGAPAWLLSHGVASVTAVVILTYFHIVIGEMVPKSFALQYAEELACWITPPMLWIKNLLFPFVVSLNELGNLISEGCRRQPAGPEQRSLLHARGASAHRAGERGARRAALGVGAHAAGAVRVRRPHRRPGDGAAGEDYRHRRGFQPAAHPRHSRGVGAHPLSNLRKGSRRHRRHDAHQGSAAAAAGEPADRPQRMPGRCRSCPETAELDAVLGGDAPRAHADGRRHR